MSENTNTPPPGENYHTFSQPNAAQRFWLRLTVWQRVVAVVVLIGGAFGFAWLAATYGGGGGGASEARQQCQARVEVRLKAPSTADFSSSSSRNLGDNENRWEVTGIVDAENSFGGTVRATYKCDLTYDPDSETWDAALVDVRE